MTTIGTKKKSYDIVIQLCEDKLKDIQMHELHICTDNEQATQIQMKAKDLPLHMKYMEYSLSVYFHNKKEWN